MPPVGASKEKEYVPCLSRPLRRAFLSAADSCLSSEARICATVGGLAVGSFLNGGAGSTASVGYVRGITWRMFSLGASTPVASLLLPVTVQDTTEPSSCSSGTKVSPVASGTSDPLTSHWNVSVGEGFPCHTPESQVSCSPTSAVPADDSDPVTSTPGSLGGSGALPGILRRGLEARSSPPTLV